MQRILQPILSAAPVPRQPRTNTANLPRWSHDRRPEHTPKLQHNQKTKRALGHGVSWKGAPKIPQAYSDKNSLEHLFLSFRAPSAKDTKVWPSWTNVRKIWAEFGPSLSNVVQIWPKFAAFWSNSAAGARTLLENCSRE